MTNYFVILPISSALLCLGLGIFTLSRNPRNPANIGFAVGLLSLVVIEAGNAITIFLASDPRSATTGMRISLAGESFLPVSWYAFSLVFARADYKSIFKKWFALLAGMGAVSIFFAANAILINLVLPAVEGAELVSFKISPLGKYLYIYLIIGIMLNLVQLENTLHSSKGVQRGQIKYVLFGIGGILLFYVYKASQALLFSSISIQIIPVMSAVTIVCVVMMAFYIVRRKLFNVDVFVSRYVVYNSISALAIGVYLLSVGLVTQGIKYFNIPFNYFFSTLLLFISALGLVILLFSASLRRKVQIFINKHFYRHKYEFRDKWMESIERISPQSSIEDLQETLTEMISVTMGAKPVCLWINDPITGIYLPASDDAAELFGKIGKDHPIVLHAKEKMSPFPLIDILENDISGQINDLVAKTDTVLCSPLVLDGDVMGFVLQGEDISGEDYGQNDFELLTALTAQAAVQIKNIRLSQDIVAAKQMDAFAKMSSFIMHDLKNLTNTLSLVSQNAKHNMDNPEFQKDAMNTVVGAVTRMKGLIKKLSTTTKGLDIKRKSVELEMLVESAIKKTAPNNTGNVSLKKQIGELPPISVDPEAMEMVFINLIKNACEAIGGDGEIDINAVANGDNVEVKISDTGCGMSEEFIDKNLFRPFKSTKDSGLGIGLYQCKSIIEAHGGAIDVKSKEGVGTTFILNLPVYKS